MLKKAVSLCLLFLITACSVKPITVRERYEEATQELTALFTEQEPLVGALTFYEALARGLKFNLDYRIKLANSALQSGQLELALYTMFPALNLSGSIYNRNNKYASSGITSNGQLTDVLTSTPNTLRSARTAISWNVLDFGMGYVKAKQQGQRVLIAEEEGRKQVQQLAQDILIAYWSAYSAQQMMKQTHEFQHLLENSKKKIALAMMDKTIPKESILNYEAALLEGNRRIIQLQYKHDKAMLDLKHLLSIPVNSTITLAPPPAALTRIQNLTHLDFKKLDAITLVKRPELFGQHYQEIVAKLGVKLAILQALPGFTLNDAWNYNSNVYLLNQKWIDRSVDTAWNLLNLASVPSAYSAAKTQVQYEKLKQMALTLTALIETRYAYSNYETIRKEYVIAHKQTVNASELYKLNRDRQLASLANDQQVILAKLRVLTTKMDEDLLLSNLSTSLGALYSSAGFDILPHNIRTLPIKVMTKVVQDYFIMEHTWDFKLYVDKTYVQLFTHAVIIKKTVICKVPPPVIRPMPKKAPCKILPRRAPMKASLVKPTRWATKPAPSRKASLTKKIIVQAKSRKPVKLVINRKPLTKSLAKAPVIKRPISVKPKHQVSVIMALQPSTYPSTITALPKSMASSTPKSKRLSAESSITARSDEGFVTESNISPTKVSKLRKIKLQFKNKGILGGSP